MKRSKGLGFSFITAFFLFFSSFELRAGTSYLCLPTCVENDGKMFSLAGVGQNTLVGDTIIFHISSAASAATFEVGFFDGDTGGIWDTNTFELEYTLFPDPLGDGSGVNTQPAIGQWFGNNANAINGPGWLTSATNMPDNAWYTITANNIPAAQGADGTYRYALKIRMPNAALPANPSPLSNFKLRVGNLATSSLSGSEFSIIGVIDSITRNIIYPNWPSLTPTTYDGIWKFGLGIFPPANTVINEVVVWDGDTDRATNNGFADGDTDDPDTPNNVLPPWAVGTSAFFESATIGAPPDDTTVAARLRTPAIYYQIKAPDGTVYVNNNPAGTEEWEQFRISTDPFNAALMDYSAVSLPPGIYELTVFGMDGFNLNAWRFGYRAVGRTKDDKPVPEGAFYAVGDFVWRDFDADGIQDPGEPGIQGVTVELLNSGGGVVESTVTDSSGLYGFRVGPGTFTVRIASSNFNSGSVLFGYASTTGGNTQTNTVVNADILTYDFGYVDVTSPSILACAANQNISAPGCQAAVPNLIPQVQATDNATSSGNLIITQSPSAGSPLPLGPTVVTITVKDESNNTATCTATLQVNDGSAPTLTCPANIALQTQPGVCTATTSIATPAATDNCSTPTVLGVR
ncbi:MAG: HYR domain-containing protein, partial [Acidobacteria bacterium]|nr:HYR domain-containing protein [Acidobacteriota bacterium]